MGERQSGDGYEPTRGSDGSSDSGTLELFQQLAQGKAPDGTLLIFDTKGDSVEDGGLQEHIDSGLSRLVAERRAEETRDVQLEMHTDAGVQRAIEQEQARRNVEAIHDQLDPVLTLCAEGLRRMASTRPPRVPFLWRPTSVMSRHPADEKEYLSLFYYRIAEVSGRLALRQCVHLLRPRITNDNPWTPRLWVAFDPAGAIRIIQVAAVSEWAARNSSRPGAYSQFGYSPPVHTPTIDAQLFEALNVAAREKPYNGRQARPYFGIRLSMGNGSSPPTMHCIAGEPYKGLDHHAVRHPYDAVHDMFMRHYPDGSAVPKMSRDEFVQVAIEALSLIPFIARNVKGELSAEEG